MDCSVGKLIRKAGHAGEASPLCHRHREEEEAGHSILDNDAVEEYVKQQTPGRRESEGSATGSSSFCPLAFKLFTPLTAGSE